MEQPASEEPVLWECEWCGAEFEPDPETMVESGFSVDWEEEGEGTWKDVPPGDGPRTLEDLSVETAAEMREEMGLDDDQLRQLLATGGVQTGYSCVCRQCQDESDEED